MSYFLHLLIGLVFLDCLPISGRVSWSKCDVSTPHGRRTQYAHFTLRFIVQTMWLGLQRLGWRGGSLFDPSIGTGILMGGNATEHSVITCWENDDAIFQLDRSKSYWATETRIMTVGFLADEQTTEVYDGNLANISLL